MKFHDYYVCPVCGEEFAVSTVIYRRSRTFLLCPCCGCVEVEPVGEGPPTPPLVYDDAAA